MLSKSRKGAILIKLAQDKKNSVTYGALPMAGGRALPTVSFDSMKPAKTVYNEKSFKAEPITVSSPAGGSPKPPTSPKFSKGDLSRFRRQAILNKQKKFGKITADKHSTEFAKTQVESKPAAVEGTQKNKSLMNRKKPLAPFDMKGFFKTIDEGHRRLKGNKV